MCKLFDEWENEIKEYCTKNELSFEKAKKMCQSWSKNDLALSYHDKSKGVNGLLDDTPMPMVLLITKTETGLNFEQTEFTKQYLGKVS